MSAIELEASLRRISLEDVKARPQIVERKFFGAGHGRLPTFWEASSREQQARYLTAWREGKDPGFSIPQGSREQQDGPTSERKFDHDGCATYAAYLKRGGQPIQDQGLVVESREPGKQVLDGVRVEHTASGHTSDAQSDLQQSGHDNGAGGLGEEVASGRSWADGESFRGYLSDGERSKPGDEGSTPGREAAESTPAPACGINFRRPEPDYSQPARHSNRGGLGARRKRTVRRLLQSFRGTYQRGAGLGWIHGLLSSVTPCEREDFYAQISTNERAALERTSPR